MKRCPLRFGRVITALIAWAAILACSGSPGGIEPKRTEQDHIGPPVPVQIAEIPPGTEIVYHEHGFIYVMDERGGNARQVTFQTPRIWEHVTVSHDRRFIAGNFRERLPRGGLSQSKIMLFDVEKGTEALLVPDFASAGNGGVSWGPDGFLYFVANPAKNQLGDVYKIKYDGTGLQQLTDSPSTGEPDVGVSRDGSLISYVRSVPDPADPHTEIWVANSDGTNQRMVYKAGTPGVNSAHDPEIAGDNQTVVFSIVNSSVPPNFPNNPAANTAHDLWAIDISGDLSSLRRLTQPGPISIIPNTKRGRVVYLVLDDGPGNDDYFGAAVVDLTCRDCPGDRVRAGANAPKWIP